MTLRTLALILALDPGWATVIVAAIGSATGVIIAMLESVRRAVKSTRNHIAAVDESVNGVPKGTPPLVARVSTVEAKIEVIEEKLDVIERRQDASDRWMTDALQAIGSQLGASLPDRRHYH